MFIRNRRVGVLRLALLLVGVLGAAAVACGGDEIVEKVVVQTVIVEKQVPGEKVVETIIVEKQVEKKVVETVIVEKQVEKKVVETVIVEKEVEKIVAGAHIRAIPRNRTLIVASRGKTAGDIWSPYALGGTHQKGVAFFYEPLWYSDNLDGNEIPWLATEFQFNADATELTYKLRDGITWSDGTTFTADDVAFTFNKLAELGSEVRGGGVFETFIDEVVAIDPLTVTLKFNFPAPRFHAEVVSFKGDSGSFIVPKHVWKDVNWAEYLNFNDGAGPVTTSPWRLAFADIDKRMIDRVRTCGEWWACATGFHDLPKVERFIHLRMEDDTTMAQAIILNEIDQTHDMRVDSIQQTIKQNPAVTTWSGREQGPYGLVSWWPTSLYVDNRDKHLGKVNVRQAINYFIDREKVNDFAYAFNGQISKYPWPAFSGLQSVNESLADLQEQYPTDKYLPDRGEALLKEAGYSKDKDGFWADASGDRIKCDIVGISFFSDLGPVVSELLRQHGIDATYSQPVDAYSAPSSGGAYTCTFFGHNGAQSGDVYRTLRLYQTDDPSNWWHYSNPEYDAIVDEIARNPDPAKVQELTHDAMAIWLKDLPDIPLVEFFNRFSINEHYWTNWPTAATTPYMNGLHLHTGMSITLMRLEPTNAE